jgi:phosphatidylserine/phosphatidylglycerophosphate/cardiolipin synthase-like enzyme
MAKRAIATPASPWDVGCKVTTFIGGYAAMSAMRDALEALISDAKSSSNPAGSKGHVYIADWRFNCQRDLSSENSWKTGFWGDANTAVKDQTAIGLILRLMQAGVIVRILVWLPTKVAEKAANLTPHIVDHTYLWHVVQRESARLSANLAVPLGIVGLDKRTATGSLAGAHHQKMLLIRSPNPNLNVAFCGGVDLAFTRRDAPSDPTSFTPETVLGGDWQSGVIPKPYKMPPGIIWPPDGGTTNYTSAIKTAPWGVQDTQGPDLPTTTDTEDVCQAIGGQWNGTKCSYQRPDGKPSNVYGDGYQVWHDQHLKLEGSIVSTLEWQFAERWIDSPVMETLAVRGLEWLFGLDPFQLTENVLSGSVAFSTELAYAPSGGLTENSQIKPLETPVDIAASFGPSVVQMWRTIPMRTRTTDLFRGGNPDGREGAGEFTIMAGISKAVSAAKELIWIFDQYFWSEPLARLINYRLQNTPTLCVVIILPPHADSTFPEIHLARQLALTELTQGLTAAQRSRVAVYNMWNAQAASPADGFGIYVHAKSHTYDGALLVCGSANMNRRSLTCDSELACAIVDSDLVAAHQQKLWNMLFANVAGAAWPSPAPDFNNSTGGGVKFLAQFQTAAASSGSYLIVDPWDDNNPLNPNHKPVALPNGVPRPPALLGPKYEIFYNGALDPGSLVPEVENDIVDPSGTLPPQPARLDDVVKVVEDFVPGSPPRYPGRRQAGVLTEQLIHMAGIQYTDGGYEFTETAQWWKQVCAGLPCFLQIGWPGYETAVIDNIQIGGQAVVLQLWMGWCQRFLRLPGMPGGVGAEVGVYRRIQGKLPEFLKQTGATDFVQKYLSKAPPMPAGQQSYWDKLQQTADVWWPFPELNASIDFILTNRATGQVFFSAGIESTYWLCKWMTPDDYDKYAMANQGPARMPPGQQIAGWQIADWQLDFMVAGQAFSWTLGDGKVMFPKYPYQ